jgi:hypothetical protein
VAEFVDHYHRERNHQGLGNELIDRVRQEQTIGGIAVASVSAGSSTTTTAPREVPHRRFECSA